MVNVFQLNKKYGEWAERTIYDYFKANKKNNGFNIFYFGSQVNTRKKDTTNAPKRPDFILIRNKDVKQLEKKYGLNFDKLNLNQLSNLVGIVDDDKKILEKNPEYWMTKVLDNKKLMHDIIKNVYCMIEVKSGFRLFSQEKYDDEKLNVILPLDFRKRIRKIQKKFRVRFNTYAIYVLLDRAYIANMDKMYSPEGKNATYSYERQGKGENKKGKYRTLLFNKSYFLGDVSGVKVQGKRKIKLNAKPYIEIINGSVMFSLKMSPARLKNVEIKVIKNLLY
ncbi:hypothetical protein A3K73_04045 [Candidatus Pacearchaeota archaeon RBG_13_36_9]|nr:MAG: hypothetical protein A3K73_04045 [Candidatus Pacearchaeota archaeon RBG_13_36_9]